MSRLFDFAGAEGMGYSQPETLLPADSVSLPKDLVRKSLPRWPRLSEPEMVRHYTWLSRRNFGIDTGFYPLGSCTMKHNPRINEVIAQIPGIADIHPHQPEHHLQGLLSIFPRNATHACNLFRYGPSNTTTCCWCSRRVHCS